MNHYDNDFLNMSLTERTRRRFQCFKEFTFEHLIQGSILFNVFTNFSFFVMMFVMIDKLNPTYKDIKDVIDDLNLIMPEIKNSFTMLKSLCSSDDFKHLCT